MADKKNLKRIKTGTISRRWQLSKAGIEYGARAVSQAAWQRLRGGDSEAALQRRQRNIDQFVHELGKLKGGVVKVGQIMATYGEYLFPPEVVDALHTLVDDTPPVQWPTMRDVLLEELGEERLAELEIDSEPIAAASMGQVHRATLKETGEALCIKIQYPGVARTIDADFNDVIRLMRLARLLESTRNIDDWLRDVRELLHREVDYRHEREQLLFAAQHLRDDARFVVPKVYDRYSTARVLAMSFEEGEPINSAPVAALPQPQRDALGQALLQLFLMELYRWQHMQTDPNLGNYRVRINTDGAAQLVLLDFGAMREIPASFAQPFGEMIAAAYREDRAAFLEQAIALDFMKADFPRQVLDDFADIGIDLVEPLRRDRSRIPAQALSDDGRYDWRGSQLPKRVAKRAMKASLSVYFALPPKEFLYIMRKLMGVYALIAELGATFDASGDLQPFLQAKDR